MRYRSSPHHPIRISVVLFVVYKFIKVNEPYRVHTHTHTPKCLQLEVHKKSAHYPLLCQKYSPIRTHTHNNMYLCVRKSHISAFATEGVQGDLRSVTYRVSSPFNVFITLSPSHSVLPSFLFSTHVCFYRSASA